MSEITFFEPDRHQLHFEQDSVVVNQFRLEKEGQFIAQHAHTYDHTSMLALGKARVFIGDDLLGDFEAPCGIPVKANCFHTIVALTDGVLLYCILNTHGIPHEQLETELIAVRNPLEKVLA